MAFTTTRVEVYESRIQSHFILGGAVHKDAEGVGRLAVSEAQAIVGKRTHALEKSIRRIGRGAAAKYTYTVNISANTYYAGWVEHGTKGPIRAKGTGAKGKPKKLKLKAGGGYPKILAKKVRGQAAQRYLERGTENALRAHGYAGAVFRFPTAK